MPRPSVSAEIIAKAIMFSYKRQIQKLPEIRLPARGAIERAANRSLVFTSLALNFSGSLMAGGVGDRSDLLREPVGTFYWQGRRWLLFCYVIILHPLFAVEMMEIKP